MDLHLIPGGGRERKYSGCMSHLAGVQFFYLQGKQQHVKVKIVKLCC